MIHYLILFLVISSSLCDQVTVSSFEGPPFSVKPKSGMYELGKLGFQNLIAGNQILAYADFNNDKFTDIVSMDDSQKIITVSIWRHDLSSFVTNSTIPFSTKVTGVIPGDFNYDGLVDLLIIRGNSDQTSANYDLFIRASNTQGVLFTNSPTTSYQITPYQHPMVIDVTGDRHLELLVYDETNGRQILDIEPSGSTYTWNKTSFSSYVSSASGCKSDPGLAFAVPHSNSFVDLNGDCAADLFLTSASSGGTINFEIWLKNTNDGKFCLVENTPVDLEISAITFSDIDQNGAVDVIYADNPADSQLPLNIHIIRNQQAGDASAPCNATVTFTSPFGSGNGNIWTQLDVNNSYATVFPLNVPSVVANPRIYSRDPVNFPGKIRVGDINIDGAADLLFTVYSANDDSPTYGAPILLFNLGSYTYLDPSTASYYSIITDTSGGVSDLSTIKAYSVSFFDFDEIGNLGLWIVATGNGNSDLIGVFNFVGSEHFFLKINVLNAFSSSNSEEGIILGGPYYGPSAECVVTTISGDKILAKTVQLPQSGHNPLDLSYMYLGLGRTNNYVEDLSVGIPAKLPGEADRVTSWTPIIPNSQLIVNPLQNQVWTLDVYVSPTKETLLVVLTTLAILIILGLLIIYYHMKEKEEDKKNQDKILHIFG